MDRLQLEPGGPRTMHFPKGSGFDGEYFKQLTSETRRVRYKFGSPYFIFEKPTNATRNEVLDCNVYALAAVYSFGRIGWDKRAAFLKTLAPPDPDAPPAPVVKKLPPRPRRNWVNSG